MPKHKIVYPERNRRGFVDPLSLIAVGFLLTSLVIGVTSTNNPVKKYLINSMAMFIQEGPGYVQSITGTGSTSTSTNAAICVPGSSRACTMPNGCAGTQKCTYYGLSYRACIQSNPACTGAAISIPTSTPISGYSDYQIINPGAETDRTGYLKDDGTIAGFYLAPNGQYYAIAESAGGPTADDLAYITEPKEPLPDTTTESDTITSEQLIRNFCLSDGGTWINNTCDYTQQQEAIKVITQQIQEHDYAREVCITDGGFWVNNFCDYTQQQEAIKQITGQIQEQENQYTYTPPESNQSMSEAEKLIQTGAIQEQINLQKTPIPTKSPEQIASEASLADKILEFFRIETEQLIQPKIDDPTQQEVATSYDQAKFNQQYNINTSTPTYTDPVAVNTEKAVRDDLLDNFFSEPAFIPNQHEIDVSIAQLTGQNTAGYLPDTPVVSYTGQTTKQELTEAQKSQIYESVADLGVTATPNTGGCFKANCATYTQEETLSTLDAITFGQFSPYVSTYQQIVAENPEQTYLTQAFGHKEGYISSISLGTTITAEMASLLAAPQILTAGATSAAGGAGFLGTSGAVAAQSFMSLGAITTMQQSGRAVSAQIEDPLSEAANYETLMAGLSWANLGTADYLIKSFSTGTSLVAARTLNTIVSGANLVVDTPMAISQCTQESTDPLTCGVAVATVVADVGFGFLDFKQGQLGIGNPFKNIDTPKVIVSDLGNGYAQALEIPQGKNIVQREVSDLSAQVAAQMDISLANIGGSPTVLIDQPVVLNNLAQTISQANTSSSNVSLTPPTRTLAEAIGTTISDSFTSLVDGVTTPIRDLSAPRPADLDTTIIDLPPSQSTLVEILLANGQDNLPNLHWSSPDGITTIETSRVSAINSQLVTEVGSGGSSVDDVRYLIRNDRFDWNVTNRDPINAYELPDGSIHIETGRHRAEALILENVSEMQVRLYTLDEIPTSPTQPNPVVARVVDATVSQIVPDVPVVGEALQRSVTNGLVENINSIVKNKIVDPISNLINPPIRSGEIFDSMAEVNTILKYPSDQRLPVLNEFKRKLSYQQKGVSDLQLKLEATIYKNPDVSMTELGQIVENYSKKFGMTGDQIEIFNKALQAYDLKHSRVLDLTNEYPNETKLFEALFGQTPVGKITLEPNPASIVITAYDPRDYYFLSNFTANTPGTIPLSYDLNIQNSGQVKSKTLLPDTDRLIIIANGNNDIDFIQEIITHENQHILYSLLRDNKIIPINDYNANIFIRLQEALSNGSDENTISVLLSSYLRETIIDDDLRYIDEIAAYLKDNTKNSRIIELLTYPTSDGGRYDFYADRKETVTDFLIKNLEIDPFLVDKSVSEVYSNSKIENALGAFDTLVTKGYSRNEAINILSYETVLANWPKVAERMEPPTLLAKITYSLPRFLQSSAPTGYVSVGATERLGQSFENLVDGVQTRIVEIFNKPTTVIEVKYKNFLTEDIASNKFPTELLPLRNHIENAAELINSGRYQEAIDLLGDQNLAQKFGITISDEGKEIYIGSSAKNGVPPEELKNISDNIASTASHEPGIINPPGVGWHSQDDFGLPKPLEIQREQSLVFIEEWIHVLQYEDAKLHGLVYNDLLTSAVDEREVATFLNNNLGVQLSEPFLTRMGYDREILGLPAYDINGKQVVYDSPTTPTSPTQVKNPIAQWIDDVVVKFQTDNLVKDITNDVDVMLTNTKAPRTVGCRGGLCLDSSDLVAVKGIDAGLDAKIYNIEDINKVVNGLQVDEFGNFHQFTVLSDINSNGYLVDLTYPQFTTRQDTQLAKTLLNKGYIPLTEENLNNYLLSFANSADVDIPSNVLDIVQPSKIRLSQTEIDQYINGTHPDWIGSVGTDTSPYTYTPPIQPTGIAKVWGDTKTWAVNTFEKIYWGDVDTVLNTQNPNPQRLTTNNTDFSITRDLDDDGLVIRVNPNSDEVRLFYPKTIDEAEFIILRETGRRADISEVDEVITLSDGTQTAIKRIVINEIEPTRVSLPQRIIDWADDTFIAPIRNRNVVDIGRGEVITDSGWGWAGFADDYEFTTPDKTLQNISDIVTGRNQKGPDGITYGSNGETVSWEFRNIDPDTTITVKPNSDEITITVKGQDPYTIKVGETSEFGRLIKVNGTDLALVRPDPFSKKFETILLAENSNLINRTQARLQQTLNPTPEQVIARLKDDFAYGPTVSDQIPHSVYISKAMAGTIAGTAIAIPVVTTLINNLDLIIAYLSPVDEADTIKSDLPRLGILLLTDSYYTWRQGEITYYNLFPTIPDIEYYPTTSDITDIKDTGISLKLDNSYSIPDFDVYMQTGDLANWVINESGITMTSDGCGPSTLYNILKLMGYDPDIRDILEHFKICAGENGCNISTDEVLLALQNKYGIEGIFKNYENNKIMDPYLLFNTTGVYIYGGRVFDSSKEADHISGFECGQGKCYSIDSYFNSGKPVECSIVNPTLIKCGDTNYEIGGTFQYPDGFYPVSNNNYLLDRTSTNFLDENINISDNPTTQNEFVYFSQNDPVWSEIPTMGSATVNDDGCGIVAGAMVTMTDPYTYWGYYSDYFEDKGEERILTNSGTSFYDHKEVLENLGYELIPVSGSLDEIKNQIKSYTQNGVPVWINTKIYDLPHNTIAVGVDSNSNIVFNDPEFGQGPIEDKNIDQSSDDGDPGWKVYAVIPPENQP